MIEGWIRWVSTASGLATLAYIFWQGVWRGLRSSPDKTTGRADALLRRPVLIVLGILWLAACLLLWKPIPISLTRTVEILSLAIGTLLYFPGLGLYLWGARTLGRFYKPSSGLGATLEEGHQLVTHGPFAVVRHPLYLGLQLAALGGLLIFRNWTFAFITVNFLGLFVRARREEQALAAEFGEAWETYRNSVHAWLPRIPVKERD